MVGVGIQATRSSCRWQAHRMSPEELAAWYLAGLDDLGLAIGPDDRGNDPSRTTDPNVVLPDVRIPNALRGWYLAAGNSRLNSVHNRILPADRLRLLDGRVVFAEENQDVVVWGYDDEDGSDDAMVWQGQPGSSADDPTVWYSEERRLSWFLVEMLAHTVASDWDRA